MFLRPCFARVCCFRIIPCLLFALALSSTAFSQQIPCPMPFDFQNSGTATNALSPCNVTASFVNNAGANLSNSGTINNNSFDQLSNNGILGNSGTLNNNLGGSVGNDGTLENSGALNNSGGFGNSGTLNNTGMLTNNAGGSFGNGNAGTLNNNATLDNNAGAALANGGTLNNNAGATINNNGVLNDGFLGATLNNAGTLNNNAGATLSLNAGTLNDGGTLNNSGTLQNEAGILNIPVGGVLNNLSGGNLILTGGAGTIVNGTLNSVPAVQIQGGSFGGAGTINGNVVTMGGDMAPGNEPALPGVLTINGDYTQLSGGVFFEQIGGVTADSQYDQLFVNGAVSLDGQLEVSLINGFTPTVGDSFVLMTYDSESGVFDNVSSFPALAGNDEFWRVTYGANDLTLSVAAPEPSTLLLLGAGLMALLGVCVKRRPMIRA